MPESPWWQDGAVTCYVAQRSAVVEAGEGTAVGVGRASAVSARRWTAASTSRHAAFRRGPPRDTVSGTLLVIAASQPPRPPEIFYIQVALPVTSEIVVWCATVEVTCEYNEQDNIVISTPLGVVSPYQAKFRVAPCSTGAEIQNSAS